MGFNIDLNKIALELDFDLEDVEMLMDVFLETANENLNKMEIAIENNNLDDIYKSAHSIKGSSGTLTLNNIYEISAFIEDSARSSIKIDYKSKFIELKNLINLL